MNKTYTHCGVVNTVQKYYILFSRENFNSLFFNLGVKTLDLFYVKIVERKSVTVCSVTNKHIERMLDRNEGILRGILRVGCVRLPGSLLMPFSPGTATRGRSSWKRTETFSQGYSLAGVFYCRGPASARVFCRDFCYRVVADRLLLSAFCGTENPASNSLWDTGRTNSSKRQKDVSREGN